MIRLDVQTNLYGFVLGLVLSACAVGGSITSVSKTETPVQSAETTLTQDEIQGSVWTDADLGNGAVLGLVVDGPSLIGLDVDFGGAGTSRESREEKRLAGNEGPGASQAAGQAEVEALDTSLTPAPALALAGAGAVLGSGFLGVVLLIRRKNG